MQARAQHTSAARTRTTGLATRACPRDTRRGSSLIAQARLSHCAQPPRPSYAAVADVAVDGVCEVSGGKGRSGAREPCAITKKLYLTT